MSWKTIIINEAEKVSLFLDSLVVTKDDYPIKFLIADLNCIIFEDPKAVITIKIANKLAINGVLVVFCDQNYMPTSILNPFDGHFMQLKIINNQLNWTIEQRRILWQRIVKQKINNQIDVLKLNEKSQEKIKLLYKFTDEIELADTTNREGHAAKVYFNELFGKEFVRTDEDSIINAALNYGYSIIRSAVSRSLVGKGLHPSISIFHKNQYDSFALADDLMEPFRPLVDDYVYKNYQNWEYFGKNEKINIINLLNCQILFDDKVTFLTNAIDKFIDGVIDFMDEGAPITNLLFPYVERINYYEEFEL